MKLAAVVVIAALMMLVMTFPQEVEGYITIDINPCTEQACKDACIKILNEKYKTSHCYGGDKYCQCFG
ncbi:hypothetical protein C2S53_018722 [Perilla frutescens var. hirtella]|uniref:Uncharacterized protein n=1 Tax=Perilla frutescens var. hirtella TaxID=608512 RepID=A0AAD4IM89_PERFH|nr:hypothetical protein C2S53_018722 [Perilla frutescens var. hirtella]